MANESTNTNENNNQENTQDQKNTEDSKKNTQDKSNTAELEARIKQLETENGKLRQANTNASAEASKYKKQYQDKLTEEDRKKEEQAEAEATLRKEVETLRAERNVANFKSQLTDPAIGFDGELAQEVAEAMNSGDTAKVFDGLRRFVVAHDKALKENALRNNQTLQGGSGNKAITKEQFDAMGYTERLEVFNQHPDLYAEYTK